MVKAFEIALQHANMWIEEIKHEMDTDDEHEAYRAMRAVLQTLRDRLPAEESAQFAAQLPMLIRGIYYQGYDPTSKPVRMRTSSDFFRHVQMRAHGRALHDVEHATRAVLAVLWQHITLGEVEDVLATLPDDVQELWAPMFTGHAY